jgi:2,3-bisphosphoglycerate-dependent phosphoglycerate mutase
MDRRFLDIFIFRHGETDYNAENRFQGSLDIPLNDRGKMQAKNLVEILRNRDVEIVLSSPLIRAYETALILAAPLNLEVVRFPELREIHCGDGEGSTRGEITARYGEEFWHRWRSVRKEDQDLAFAGGESKRACARRAVDFFERLIAEDTYSSIAIASHGAFMRYAIHAVIDFGVDPDPIPTPNCAVYQLRFHRRDRQWELIDLNNHLT